VQCAFAVLHMIAISGVTDACTGGTRGHKHTCVRCVSSPGHLQARSMIVQGMMTRMRQTSGSVNLFLLNALEQCQG
jgi:hypothetical protein